MGDIKSNLSDRARETARRLETFQDDLRLRLHLAGMDASDAWKTVKAQLDKIRHNLDDTGAKLSTTKEEADLQTHLGIMEAKARFEGIKETLSEMTTRAKEKLDPAIDTARLHAHLAQLDARDMVEKRRDEVKKKYQSAKTNLVADATHVLDRLMQAVDDLKKKL